MGLDDSRVTPATAAPPSRTALVVLGCRVLPSGRPGNAALRRVIAAARAWHEGRASWVIASGGRRWGQQAEATVLCRELVQQGIPSARIVEELCSLSTRENAAFSAPILQRLGLAHALVVTCDWHMRRALSNFAAAGVRASAWPAPAPPPPPWTRVARFLHERVGEWLDRAAGIAPAAVVAHARTPR